MRIVVIASTGRTGRLVVAEAARRGHDVVAVARHQPVSSPSARVTPVTAPVQDTTALARAMQGADAVVSAIGTGTGRRETDLYSLGTERLVDAMWSAGLRRLVVVSAVPVGPATGTGDRVLRRVLYGFFGGTYRDMARMERLLEERTDVDATVVRPPRLVDGPVTGYRRAEDTALDRVGRISRADLAIELVDQAERVGAGLPRCVTVAR